VILKKELEIQLFRKKGGIMKKEYSSAATLIIV